MSDPKVAEAQECIKKAEKYLKTSLLSLKFKPDFDSAASEYERAAVCYKNARKLKESRDAYLKAAENHESNGILFHSAKCKENAALLSRDLGEMDKAKDLMLKASQQYAETGTPETSAQALDKAAKFFENVDPETAVEVYLKAYQIVQETDRTRQASQFLNRLTKLYLKLERLEEAANNIKEEIDMYCEMKEGAKVGRLTTGLVLIQLQRGDSVEANKGYQASFRCEGFAQTEDAVCLGSLISAFETGEKDKFQKCLNRPHMKSMDNEFLRIMKKLEPPFVAKKDEGGGGEDVEEEDVDLK